MEALLSFMRRMISGTVSHSPRSCLILSTTCSRVRTRANASRLGLDVTVIEGTSDPDAICVMMAVSKHTIVSFEVSGPGTWTIRDSQGGAPPVEVVVS